MKKNKSIETLITELKNSPPQNNFINTMNAFSDLHQLDSYLIDLLKELPMPVWSYNEEGRVIFWNKEAERKFGFSQLFILNGFDIFGLWVQIRDLDQKAILEKKLKTKSGQYRDINLYVYRKTLNRKESQIWIFGDDHTIVMETVQELEKRFNHLLNLQQIINKSEAIAYIRNNDTNGTFIYISANCNRLGYHPAEFISNEIGLWQLIDTQDIESVNAEVQHAIQNKQSHLRLEYRLINKEGNPLWVSDTFSILYNPEDICTSFQGVITDISLWK